MLEVGGLIADIAAPTDAKVSWPAARRAGYGVTLAETLIAAVSMRWQPERVAESIAAAEEAMQLAWQAGDRSLHVMAL